jgi:aspartyl-tRNA(Asn)/glutamyl-tRNA(Gln) amidotransferase subunit B
VANNPKLVADYATADEGRKPRVIKGLMGQVMKASKGKANPTMVMEILVKKLS